MCCGVGTDGGTAGDGERYSKKGIEQAGYSSTEKRDMIQQMKQDYPLQTVRRALGVPVSSAYYGSSKRDDTDLLAVAEAILLRFPFYWYRKLSKTLQRSPATAAPVGHDSCGRASARPDDRQPLLPPASSQPHLRAHTENG